MGSKIASRLIFRQLFDAESYTFTYLLGCSKTRKAVLIDPVDTKVERDKQLIQDLDLQLVYAMNTHVHADHITGSGLLRTITGCKTAIGKFTGAKTTDIYLADGDEIEYGAQTLKAQTTPGHTNGCMTFVDHANKMAFTGDALLIRACGRTDFQEGNAEKLYDSVHSKIFTLPREFLLYPAHDYKGMTVTSVDEELRLNPRLTKSKSEFVEIMNSLGLTRPKKIDEALPINMMCGPSQLGELPADRQRMDQ